MRELEATIVREVSDLLTVHGGLLQNSGRTWNGPIIVIWDDSPGNYTSEFKITTYKDGRLNDVFEFHLFRNGSAVVTKDDVLLWINQRLEEIKNRTLDERK
jgi:hypothetical protein